MKSTGDYDELFSISIAREEELVDDAAGGPFEHIPLVEGSTDYEDYLRKLTRR